MSNQITVDNGSSIVAFINTVGVNKDTSVEDHNEMVNTFINLFNQGTLSVTAFTNKEGKIVIGFK